LSNAANVSEQAHRKLNLISLAEAALEAQRLALFR
jgi:hypothetical protein